MVSLPPINPSEPARVEPEAVGKQRRGGPPESVRLMLASWAIMIAGELLHQALTVIAVAIDPSPLREAAKMRAKGEELTDAALNTGVYASVVVMALIQLTFVLLLAMALRAIKNKASWSLNARRLLQVFAGYFAIRVLALFATVPSASTLPVAFYGVDGAIQIILGVAGICGIVYSADKESVNWTGSGPKSGGKQGERKDL